MNNVPVLFKTEKHIKAYLLNNFGERPSFDCSNIFHDFLLLALSHTQRNHLNEIQEFPESMTIYITKSDYKNFGCWLNLLQMKYLNKHIDAHIKEKLVLFLNTYLDMSTKKNLSLAIEFALVALNISEEDWDPDSIKRFYHRYRKRSGMPSIFDIRKNF